MRLTSVEPAAVTMQGRPAPDLVSADDRWIASLRAGEPAALEQLARVGAPRVAGLLRSLLGARADIEDLVQTVFLETCRALPGFRGDSAVSTFIGGITVRVARRAMRPSAWTRLRSEWVDEPRSNGNPEESAQQAEQLRRMHDALARLSSKKRAAFLLWALEGMDVPAIAELMEASVSATKSRILYAQRELRQRAERDPYLRELVKGPSDG
jgi:RNA polymerase sigma-70 factor, ECF subfamily